MRSTPLKDYRILHFATHGLVAGDLSGLTEPALVLTLPPVASETDDGLLTASEIATLSLDADWVVLSACNTVVTDMISVQYLMSRDGELPQAFQGLNRFGVPLAPALVATVGPCLVLVVSHDLEKLAALYAIGVVGAVAINVTLVATHPRLRRWWRWRRTR